MGVAGCPVGPVSPGWDHWTMSWVTPPCQRFLPGVSSAVLFLFLWACWLLLFKLSNGARFHKPALYIHWRKAQTGCEDGGNMRGMSWRSCHWHALHELVIHLLNRSRHVHELFVNTSRIGHDKESCHKFWTFQNLLPDLARSHDTFKNILQLVYALPRLNSWQCVPQSRASVRVPLDILEEILACTSVWPTLFLFCFVFLIDKGWAWFFWCWYDDDVLNMLLIDSSDSDV